MNNKKLPLRMWKNDNNKNQKRWDRIIIEFSAAHIPKTEEDIIIFIILQYAYYKT